MIGTKFINHKCLQLKSGWGGAVLRATSVCTSRVHHHGSLENSSIESCTERYSSQFENNCSAEMWSDSQEGSYLRFIDCCITQL